MAIDVSGLMKSLGMAPIGRTDQTSGNNVYNKAATAAKPASGAGAFAKNVASSAAKFASGAVGAVAGGIAKDITTTARGISQGLPGLGTIDRNQGAFDRRMADISRAQKTFTKQYKDGKISRERYTKLLQDLNKDQQSANKLLQDEAKGYTKPEEFVKSLAVTGTLPLAAGRLVGVANAGKLAGAQNTLSKLPGTVAQSSIGGTKGVAAAQSLRGAATAAALAPVKSALMYAPTADSAVEGTAQFAAGDYKGAAKNAALLAAPVGILGASKLLPKAGKALSTAVYGKPSGPINSFFGNKAVEQAVKNNPNLGKVLKQAELFTQDQPAVKRGVPANEWFKKYLTETLDLDPKNLSIEEFATRFRQYSKPAEQLSKLKAAGKVNQGVVLTANYGKRVQAAIKNLGADFDNTPMIDRTDVAKRIANEVAGDNPTARDKIADVLIRSEKLDDALKEIKQLDRLPGTKIPGFKTPEGFRLTPAGPKQQAQITELANVTGDLEQGKDAAPVLGLVGKALEKSGLSTQSKGAEVYAKYNKYLDEELSKLGFKSKDVLAQIRDYTKNGRGGVGIFDERQLSTKAVKNALGITDSAQANQVRKAIINSYGRISLGDLGMAGKIENALYKIPGYGAYRRIQGIGRYEFNPFFRLQSAVEAELLSQNVAKGKGVHVPATGWLLSKFNAKKSDRLIKNAEKLNSYLDEGYSAMGTTDNSFGPITAKLFENQKLSLGGLVETLAKRSGASSVDEFLKNADPKVLDNIRMVVQYPRQGYLSSNFAKTMNTLVFPSRYTTKLAMVTGKALADMPPLLQIGTLKSLSDFQDFLSSDEGIKWKAENSEVIGIINYLNPLNNIGKIVAGVKNKDLQISDIGLIGGLPLGVITQLIKTQTGAMAGTPYQNPKTGELILDELPANTQGRVKLAIIDIINTMYSYSGRTFGFDLSKKEITGSLPGLKLQKGDTVKNTNQKPSANQERVQRVLRGGSTTQKPTTPVSNSKKATVYGKGDNLPVSPGVANRLNAAKAEAAAKKAKKGKKAKPKAFRPRPL